MKACEPQRGSHDTHRGGGCKGGRIQTLPGHCGPDSHTSHVCTSNYHKNIYIFIPNGVSRLKEDAFSEDIAKSTVQGTHFQSFSGSLCFSYSSPVQLQISPAHISMIYDFPLCKLNLTDTYQIGKWKCCCKNRNTLCF